jgi:catecholate siderophore receptor
MSRQQKRAEERRRNKTALQKICIAAGEGVGRAVAFSFALASNAAAAEPKEETFSLPPVVVQEQSDSYVVPQLSLPKFPEPLKDTPQSITIVPGKLIQEQAGSTLRDALRNVTGIGINAGEGGGAQGDSFTLRGFNARNDMFIDGIRDQGTYFRDTFNLEAVEVLKGPSSSYFGRGSTGGIINQVSKTAGLARFYDGDFTGGSDFYLRGTLDFNQPLTAISPNAALRVNLMGHRNDIAERDVVDNRRLGFAPSIAFGLGTPTQLTVSYFTQYEDNIPDDGLPFGPDGDPVRVNRGNFYGLRKDYERTFANVGTARLDHQFNDQLSVRNTLRLSHVHREVAPTLPQLVAATNTINRSRPIRDTKEVIVSNQTDLTTRFDTFGLGHVLTSGIELSRESVDVLRYSQTTAANGLPPTSLFNPSHSPDLTGVTKTLAADSFTGSLGFGIYAADTLKVTDYFDIVGGVRWDYFSTRFDDQRPNSTDFNNIDRMFSYRGGLVFKPTNWQSYYFSYGTSFNPSAEAIALAANNQETDPEKNETFEIGAKFDFFNGGLSLTGALFRIEKTNARTPGDITGTFQVLDGKQLSQGFEVGATGRVLPGLNIFAGYTYLDAEITKANDFGNAIPLEGKVPQNVPKHSATLWATYDFLDRWQIGGGPTYVGSRYANNQNTNKVDGYLRWDSTIAYKVTENVSLRFNAQNITNAHYFESLHPSHVIPGAGRTFLFGTGFRF